MFLGGGRVRELGDILKSYIFDEIWSENHEKRVTFATNHEIINFSRENNGFCSKKEGILDKTHFYRLLDKKHALNRQKNVSKFPGIAPGYCKNHRK